MGCVSWLTIDLNPYLFLTDVLSGLSVYAGISRACCSSADALLRYGDKLLALDDGSGRCSEFVGATLDLVADLATLVKKVGGVLIASVKVYACVFIRFSEWLFSQNHSHGLVWNPRGEDFVVEELSTVAEEDGRGA